MHYLVNYKRHSKYMKLETGDQLKNIEILTVYF